MPTREIQISARRLYIYSNKNEIQIGRISGDNCFSRVKVFEGFVPEMIERNTPRPSTQLLKNYKVEAPPQFEVRTLNNVHTSVPN